MLGSYFNSCNAIDNHNGMHQSDLSVEKYWVTYSGSFRIATGVVLGVVTTYQNIRFYCGILDQSRDKEILWGEKICRSFCDIFNKPFAVYCGGVYLNLTPMYIDDIFRPNNRFR